jgi:hypothetical protein
MKNFLYFFLKLLFVFAILFDINFKFLPSLTTSRIAFFIIVILAFFRKDKQSTYFIYYLFFLSIILFFSVLQFFYSGDFTQTSRIIWFSLYGIVTPFLFKNYVKSNNEFFYLIGIAVLIQAILTIFSFLMPSVKSVFSNLILSSSNYDESNVLRAMGFATVGGASFSVIQSTGVISFIILAKLNKWSLIKSFLIWFSILIILISIFFIGRTGMFISLTTILAYVISLKVKLRNVIVTITFIFLAFQINYTSLIENLTSRVDGFRSDLFIEWIESSFKVKDNETTVALNEMPVPPLSFETLIGTGRVRDVTGLENASGHDSGYVQTYYSLGLILATCFYLSFLIFLFFLIYRSNFQKYNDSINKKILYMLVLLLFFIEIKEPFIFYYSFPFFVLSCIFNLNKEISFNNLKNIKREEAFIN